MARRFYTNTAVPTALTAGVAAGDTLLPVASTAGYPAVPFTIGMDRGTSSEEVCLVTAKTANSLTVTRGYDGTTAVAHDPSAPVEHCVAAIDYDEANAHVNSDGVASHTGLLPRAGGTISGGLIVTGALTGNGGITATGLTLSAALALAAGSDVSGGRFVAAFDKLDYSGAGVSAHTLAWANYGAASRVLNSGSYTISQTWPTMNTDQIYVVAYTAYVGGTAPTITWAGVTAWVGGTPTLEINQYHEFYFKRVYVSGAWRVIGSGGATA